MFICKKVKWLENWRHVQSTSGLTIGFVPTMGALHQGHISLVEASRRSCDVTLVSIFVNPLQFNDPRDLDLYPRPVEQDLRMLYQAGTDAVFLPEVDEVYPKDDVQRLDFDPGFIGDTMEGKFRPGHFAGVAEVVYRLLSWVQPDQLFMGQKDYQQVALIQKLIRDTNLPVTLVRCPTLREPNGLAMSSRNARLSPEARQRAGNIYEMLSKGAEWFQNNMAVSQIQHMIRMEWERHDLHPEYIEIVDGNTLQPVQRMGDADTIVACCAVMCDGVRLIDNLIWKDK